MKNRRCIIIGSSPETGIDTIRRYINENDFIVKLSDFDCLFQGMTFYFFRNTLFI